MSNDGNKLVDLSQAVVIAPSNLSGPEQKAVTMLIEEVEKRTQIRWQQRAAWPTETGPVIAVGPAAALKTLVGPYTDKLLNDTSDDEETGAAEGYRIRTISDEPSPAVFVIGNDSRGVLFGVGHILRTMLMRPGRIRLPANFSITTAPAYSLRGHQLGYRDKTNSYCAWDLPQWEQYIRDLVVFGANAIELIPPRSDDRLESVHFPLPPLEMMAGMSRLANEYDVDVWIWFPAMDEDYGKPETVEFALREWDEVFSKLPRIDALFVPGGDPGRTQPKLLMAMLEKQAVQLKRRHPQGQMWISPQGFKQAWMDEFVDILREEKPDWLTGLVFGPWIHMSMAQFRALIPEQYPIRNYPDITHCLSCQYPVPEWDVAYALTIGREPVNPRPRDQAIIFKASQLETVGFLTYSEGCNDDVNKAIWSGLGWDPASDVVEILREYSRYFIGERYSDDFAQGLLALERNWIGPLAVNRGVYTTLQQFQALEAAASPHDLRNWRFQQALYRAYYDAYIRSRLLYEVNLEEQALDQLRQAEEKGLLVALAEAERILDQAVNQRIAQSWRTRIFQLAEALFQSIRMQLSVKLYQGQEEVRGANLDGVDYPLNNGPWLKERFAALRELSNEADRLKGIKDILEWSNPGPGGFYDDLVCSFEQPHLIKGPGFEQDPAFVETAARRYPYRKDPRPLRLSWRGATGVRNDAPFRMRYADLDSNAKYRLRVIYSGLAPQIKVRLEANNGLEIHPFIVKKAHYGPMEFPIPQEATQSGELILTWYREPGLGGSGVGCEICELWLIKET